MKTLFSFFVLQTVVILSVQSQPVSDYSYKLDNGIVVKTERCWNQVWVQQNYAPLNSGDKTPFTVNIRTLGDLISGSSYKLQSSGKEVRLQDVKPGTYDLMMAFKLSGKPGTLSFVVGNIIIKPKTKTSLSITLYDYQISIVETKASQKGLSGYESVVNRCKGHTIQDIYSGIPTFYEKGNHDKVVKPDEAASDTKGAIKSGTYDVLISIVISDQTHKVWLENFLFKPDVKYRIALNLNAGGIIYTGGNKAVTGLHMYPAGTASKQTGNPSPIKNLETISYNKATIANCCSPGTYDVLLQYSNGSKYEWRKNIAISTGVRTEVK